MSLLNIRRERRQLGNRYRRPPSIWRLLAYLLLVAAAFYWLNRF